MQDKQNARAHFGACARVSLPHQNTGKLPDPLHSARMTEGRPVGKLPGPSAPDKVHKPDGVLHFSTPMPCYEALLVTPANVRVLTTSSAQYLVPEFSPGQRRATSMVEKPREKNNILLIPPDVSVVKFEARRLTPFHSTLT